MNANSRLSNANANEREFLNKDEQRELRTNEQIGKSQEAISRAGITAEDLRLIS